MNKHLKNLPWTLIVILALVQLVRPILSTLEVLDEYHAQRQLAATVIIAGVWVGVAVAKRLREPVKTLVAAGIMYALLSTVMAVVLQSFFDWNQEDTVSIPLLLTMGLLGNLVANIAWGAALGFVAKGILRLRQPSKRR